MDDISINNLQWISIFSPEEGIQKNTLKETDFSKLSLKDIRIMDNICTRLKDTNKFGASETNRWIEQVENMKKSGVKYEIDAIADMEKHLDAKIKELL
ncbi:meiotic recombination protein SPO11 [Plasmodium yoelii yoelii]|uniref:Meiotic recombination protein SPO11 n=3 Tax=Plasmodium yoelii TaxID=5861 RepID=A0AAE9X337_PLAYO|nr:meiotic recombination protein SPO11 [Plasmodium yoelii yoelii]